MDILAHTLWANAGARGANEISKKKGGKFHMHAGWTAFFGVAPDFFAFSIPFIVGIFQITFQNETFYSFAGHHGSIGGFDLASYLYQFSHSLIIFALVFILVWVISKRPRWELLGWALHILIDIPSHILAFYPTPFLFPISDYRFPYGIQWSNMWYMIINYSLLFIIWGRIFWKKYFLKSML
ncbi:MAG: hypothetical protein KBD52_00870 [Candidatus Pacebacteria bacterium]|nr:hypothetical protein [Candidatus Paceibacterota bacterium]